MNSSILSASTISAANSAAFFAEAVLISFSFSKYSLIPIPPIIVMASRVTMTRVTLILFQIERLTPLLHFLIATSSSFDSGFCFQSASLSFSFKSCGTNLAARSAMVIENPLSSRLTRILTNTSERI